MFDDDPDPDVRSDVFSLAATIWTLLAGRTPFEVPGRSNGTLDLIGRIERGAITRLDRDDVPASLVAVLTKGMAVRRVDRYQSAVEFARALQRVELELGYAPTGIEVPSIGGADEPDAAATPADDAPETRVRGVATILAQPVAPPPAREDEPGTGAARPELDPTRVRGVAVVSPSAPPAPVPDHTVVRPRPRPAPAVEEPAPPADEPARRRIPPMGVVIAIVALVVVAAAVTTSIVLTGGGTAGPSPTPRASGSSAVVAGAPEAPRFIGATPSADGTSITFTFAPVKNAAGYQWAPGEDADAKTSVRTPVVVRTGLTPNQRVCVKLDTIAPDGRTSDATTGCYP